MSWPTKLYFIQICVDNGPIKIGIASNVSSRFKTLQSACPWKLDLMGTVDGNYPMETSLHDHLRNHNIHSEWYHSNPQVIEIIKQILNWSFDWKSIELRKSYYFRRKGPRLK